MRAVASGYLVWTLATRVCPREFLVERGSRCLNPPCPQSPPTCPCTPGSGPGPFCPPRVPLLLLALGQCEACGGAVIVLGGHQPQNRGSEPAAWDRRPAGEWKQPTAATACARTPAVGVSGPSAMASVVPRVLTVPGLRTHPTHWEERRGGGNCARGAPSPMQKAAQGES